MKKVFNVERLLCELWDIIDKNPMSFRKFSQEIGVSQHTLLDFLYEKRQSSRVTLCRIEQYIEKCNKIAIS